VISATGWAAVARSIGDGQALWGSAEGMLFLWVVDSDGSNLDGGKMDDGGEL